MLRGDPMTSREIIDAVLSSQPSEWHLEELRGFDGHAFVATLNSNASIKILWGKTRVENFHEPWLKTLLKSEVSSEDAEILHEGHPLWTETYLMVENRRALLPMPRVGTQTVPADQMRFVGLLNALSRNDSTYFNAYLKLNGIEEIKEEWPQL
jgi:hypothetical protein